MVKLIKRKKTTEKLQKGYTERVEMLKQKDEQQIFAFYAPSTLLRLFVSKSVSKVSCHQGSRGRRGEFVSASRRPLGLVTF